MAVTVSPSPVTVKENATQQFSASTPSTWTTNCGSISSTGLFRAPLYPKVCTITATAKNGGGTTTASVNVVSPGHDESCHRRHSSGSDATIHRERAGHSWTAACGSITSGGLYTASAPVGKYCTSRASQPPAQSTPSTATTRSALPHRPRSPSLHKSNSHQKLRRSSSQRAHRQLSLQPAESSPRQASTLRPCFPVLHDYCDCNKWRGDRLHHRKNRVAHFGARLQLRPLRATHSNSLQVRL